MPHTSQVPAKFVKPTAEVIRAGFLTEDFPNLPEMINEAVKDVQLLKIDSEEKIPIANTRLKNINALLKHVEDMRKKMKAPFIQTGKDIEGQANTYKNPLESAKKTINASVLAFKTQQAAEIQIKQDNERKAREAEAQERQSELELLRRIRTQINARLFGGQYVTGGGMVVPCEPCTNVQQVTDIYLYLQQNWPPFKHLEKDAEKTKQELNDMVLNHQKEIVALVASGKLEETIALKRHQAQNDTLIATAKVEQAIEHTEQQEERSMQKEVKAATKGVRVTLTFAVEDLSQVPVEYLQINSAAVNEYIKTQKEAIRNGLQAQAERPIVPGIRFYEHSTFVAK